MGETLIEGDSGVLRISARGEIMLNGKCIYAPPDLPGYKGDSARAVQLHFLECLRTGGEMESSIGNYWNTFATVDAAYQSVAASRSIPVG